MLVPNNQRLRNITADYDNLKKITSLMEIEDIRKKTIVGTRYRSTFRNPELAMDKFFNYIKIRNSIHSMHCRQGPYLYIGILKSRQSLQLSCARKKVHRYYNFRRQYPAQKVYWLTITKVSWVIVIMTTF